MTLAENVALPLTLYTGLDARSARTVAAYKLALVGLAGFEDFAAGGDQRRHGQAGGDRAGDGARSGDPVPRRAVGRPRPGHLAPPRRPDPRPQEDARDELRHRHPRAGEHLPRRRPRGLSRRRQTHHDGHGPPKQLLAESGDAELVAFLSGGEGRPRREPRHDRAQQRHRGGRLCAGRDRRSPSASPWSSAAACCSRTSSAT